MFNGADLAETRMGLMLESEGGGGNETNGFGTFKACTNEHVEYFQSLCET
jgi:hypothetical protein